MTHQPRPVVLVVGSLHYDIMLAAPGLPRRDETLVGSGWQPKFGGKGGNQAVAAARAGAVCRMLGAVGTDSFADFLRDGLQAGGVDAQYVQALPGVGSGMSVAISDPSGDYAAVIVSGANLEIDAAALGDAALWQDVKVLVLQNEVPETVNLAAARVARARSVPVILNAAPMRELSRPFAALVDVLVVNAVEAEMMGAGPVSDLSSAAAAAETLAAHFAAVVVTAGSAGLAAWSEADDRFSVPARRVKVRSTHGAGDVFTGVLAAETAKGTALHQACRAASDAAAAHVAGGQSAVSARHKAHRQGRSLKRNLPDGARSG